MLTMTSFGNHMGVYVQDSTKMGWLTSILELGAWFGTVYSGFLSEILSRKYAIMINTAIFMVGVVVQCTATTASSHNSILGGRFVTGMGVGSLSMVVPMYVAECAPPEVRGLLVGLQQFAIEFGILISFWIDYGTNYIGGTGETQSDAAWLLPLALQLAPALLLFVGMFFMPFTPRWLVHHDHEDEARKTLATLRGCPMDDPALELEFLEIKAQSLFEKRTVASKFPSLADGGAWNTVKLQYVAIASLFKTKPMFRRVIVATLTMFFQQWTGINAILYYAPTIFKDLGLSSNTVSLLATGVVGIVMFLATIPAILYIDKLGRKPVLALGALAMGACHLIVAVIFAKNENQWPTHRAAGWGAVAMIWLFVANFGWSWGPCSWIIVAEWVLSSLTSVERADFLALESGRCRPALTVLLSVPPPTGYVLAMALLMHRLTFVQMNNFIVGQVTPDMLRSLRWGTFVFFGLIIILGAGFVWFFVPETKQLTLEEMDLIFGSSGVAAADRERMEQINREIGLTQAVEGSASPVEKAVSVHADPIKIG